jgi:hypothetical protein
MASFAEKVRSNETYKAAAQSMGKKPKEVKTRQAFQRVKAYAAKQKETLPAGGGRSTVGASTGSGYSPVTIGGNSFNAGTNMLNEIGNTFPDNEIVGGEVVGQLLNAAGSLVNLGIADQYTRNTLGALGQYNAGEDIRKTGQTKDLMSTEAALTGNLYRVQGDEARKGYVTQGEQERLNIGATGREQRLGYQEQGAQERLNIGATGREQRLGYQEQGAQERQTLQQKTTEELKLRADARGAIRSQGARFYA